MFGIKEVKAHCDIPCKIYDPATAQIATLSVIRLLDLIHEVGDSVVSAADTAKIVRLTDQKEIHAASMHVLLINLRCPNQNRLSPGRQEPCAHHVPKHVAEKRFSPAQR